MPMFDPRNKTIHEPSLLSLGAPLMRFIVASPNSAESARR